MGNQTNKEKLVQPKSIKIVKNNYKNFWNRSTLTVVKAELLLVFLYFSLCHAAAPINTIGLSSVVNFFSELRLTHTTQKLQVMN